MKPAANTFQEVIFENSEETYARQINPYTYCYIQNKVAAYAKSVLEFEYDKGSNLQDQLIQHERMKAQVLVLQELLSEFTVPSEATQSQT